MRVSVSSTYMGEKMCTCAALRPSVGGPREHMTIGVIASTLDTGNRPQLALRAVPVALVRAVRALSGEDRHLAHEGPSSPRHWQLRWGVLA